MAGVLLGLLLALLIEEILFRAWLRSATYTLLIGPVVLSRLTNHFSIGLGLATLSSIGWLVSAVRNRSKTPLQRMRNNHHLAHHFSRAYPFVYWLSAAAFAIAHINNYQYTGWSGRLVILAVIPQFILGLVCSYLRIRDGLVSAIAFHYASNGLLYGFVIALVSFRG